MAAERGYVCFFYVGDDHDEVWFTSAHRAGSKRNRADAYQFMTDMMFEEERRFLTEQGYM